MPTMLIRKSRPELFVKILMMDMPMMPNSPNRAMLPTLDRSMRVADPISDMARNMPAEATNAIVMSPFVYTIKTEDSVSPFTAAYVRNRSPAICGDILAIARESPMTRPNSATMRSMNTSELPKDDLLHRLAGSDEPGNSCSQSESSSHPAIDPVEECPDTVLGTYNGSLIFHGNISFLMHQMPLCGFQVRSNHSRPLFLVKHDLAWRAFAALYL